LRNIYEKVEGFVFVNGELSESVLSDVGVRQGCVLSPFLYSIFINGLIKKIRKSGLGVKISENETLETLFFADDIVLFTNNRYDLQKLLKIVHKYSKKWRFEINVKKSSVVMFGMRYTKKLCV
jgi:hypothetical protein